MKLNKKKFALLLARLKKKVFKYINKKKYNKALDLIKLIAKVFYIMNQTLYDSDIENAIEIISEKISHCTKLEINEEIVLFYDGFGLDNRGLAQIYLKSLSKNKKIVYVVNASKLDSLPEIKQILKENGVIECIKSNNTLAKIYELKNIINKYAPKQIFNYSYPNDVVPIVSLNNYKNQIETFQINLTDHAFWIGTRCFDHYIEFRDYGASLSYYQRNIPKEKLIKIPFYPNIDQNYEFQGFPFEYDEDKQKVIFSGGSLYKTFDKENTYYKLVENILKQNEEIIFWYAGDGDLTKLNWLMSNFPNRVFHSKERKDLYQLLQHCFLYLNTYPIGGGLMTQYSAAAGKIPLTLFEEEISGLLIDQNTLGIEFQSSDEILNEIKLLIANSEYLKSKQIQVQNAVPNKHFFDQQLISILLSNKQDLLKIRYEDYDLIKLRETYMESFDFSTSCRALLTRNIRLGIANYPFRYFSGCLFYIKDKIINRK